MKKRNIVVANWKMNPETLEEAKRVFGAVKRVASALKNTDIVICPPLPFLYPLLKSKLSKNLFFGAQNIASEVKGAFTGEVSALMVKNIGVTFGIIGHSERRAMGETNEIIRKKLEASFNNKIIPILCIGERARDKEGAYLEFIKTQIKECLTGLQKKNLLGLIIAYEPIWVIGKSYRESMNPTDIHEMTLFIKKVAGEMFGKDIASSFKILYGGSVEAENIFDMIRLGNVDGFLVGHASLVTQQFSEILRVVDMKK